MKYLVMIQARCGSTRLPNKVLKDLCGKPALQRMIERVQRSRLADEVMVVTSVNRENLPILALCASVGVRVGVGAEDDVLDRVVRAQVREGLLDLALHLLVSHCTHATGLCRLLLCNNHFLVSHRSTNQSQQHQFCLVAGSLDYFPIIASLPI